MSQKIGYGYGSEWHLLRYLGYHRKLFNNQIKNETDLEIINWFDFKFSGKNVSLEQDEEYEGLEFLNEEQHPKIKDKWGEFWPSSGRQQNWDAVAKAMDSGNESYVLVEAKANLKECKSICHAKPISENGGRDKILNTMEEVINSFTKSKNVDPEKWLNKYYQYANRLAVLHFLNKNGINTNLLFVYFIGDKNPGAYYPDSEEKWVQLNTDIHQHLEIDLDSPLLKKVKHLYLPVQHSTQTKGN